MGSLSHLPYFIPHVQTKQFAVQETLRAMDLIHDGGAGVGLPVSRDA